MKNYLFGLLALSLIAATHAIANEKLYRAVSDDTSINRVQVMSLLKSDPTVNVNYAGPAGPIFSFIASSGDVELVDLFLARSELNLNYNESNYASSLMQAISSSIVEQEASEKKYLSYLGEVVEKIPEINGSKTVFKIASDKRLKSSVCLYSYNYLVQNLDWFGYIEANYSQLIDYKGKDFLKSRARDLAKNLIAMKSSKNCGAISYP